MNVYVMNLGEDYLTRAFTTKEKAIQFLLDWEKETADAIKILEFEDEGRDFSVLVRYTDGEEEWVERHFITLCPVDNPIVYDEKWGA